MLKEKIVVNKGIDKYVNLNIQQLINTTEYNDIDDYKQRAKESFINFTPDEETIRLTNSASYTITFNFYVNSVYTTDFKQIGFTDLDYQNNRLTVRKSFYYFPVYDGEDINTQNLVGYVYLKLKPSLMSHSSVPTTNFTFNIGVLNMFFLRKEYALSNNTYYMKARFFNSVNGTRYDMLTLPFTDTNKLDYWNITLNKTNKTFTIDTATNFYENVN